MKSNKAGKPTITPGLRQAIKATEKLTAKKGKAAVEAALMAIAGHSEDQQMEMRLNVTLFWTEWLLLAAEAHRRKTSIEHVVQDLLTGRYRRFMGDLMNFEFAENYQPR